MSKKQPDYKKSENNPYDLNTVAKVQRPEQPSQVQPNRDPYNLDQMPPALPNGFYKSDR
jgi:hypothetical protein